MGGGNSPDGLYTGERNGVVYQHDPIGGLGAAIEDEGRSEMYVISREGVQTLIRKLQDPVEAVRCRSELEKMLEIKEVLSWRAEAPPSVSVRLSMSPGLHAEAQLLRAALDAFDKGSYDEAGSLVAEFYREAERNLSFPW